LILVLISSQLIDRQSKMYCTYACLCQVIDTIEQLEVLADG